MATMNVSLPSPMKDWVEEQVKSGLYSNASDYIRHLIRHDQQYNDNKEMLVKAVISGNFEQVDDNEYLGLNNVKDDIRRYHGLASV